MKKWEFEIRPITKFGTDGPVRFGLYIKGDYYQNARAIIYDKDIAEELALQLGLEKVIQ